MKMINIDRTMSGTRKLFNSFIFSMPSMTAIAPSIAMTRPSRGTPTSDLMTNSPPASMEQSDIPAEKNIPACTILPLGMRFSFPAHMNIQHSAAINTDDSATFSGDELPKNSAISRPDEKPAPIAVPIYKKVAFKEFFTSNHMRYARDI